MLLPEAIGIDQSIGGIEGVDPLLVNGSLNKFRCAVGEENIHDRII